MNTHVADSLDVKVAGERSPGVRKAVAIDAVCREFDRVWHNARQRRSIREVVESVESDLQPDVLRELIAIEWEFRLAAGESVDIELYRHEFADFSDVLDDTFCNELNASDTDAPVHASPSIPERFDDFEVIREIGRGGMGIVYAARQTTLDRDVAIKILPHAALWDERVLKRFQREAQAHAKLRHPHIVPVFGVGQCEGVHYFVMDLIEGRSLALRAGHDGKLGSESQATEIARIGRQIADALQHAHNQGVLHRDVKPSNLMIDKDDHVWLTDFSLARHVHGASDLTETGEIHGTVRYMPPEAFQGKTDARSDVYGLGVTLYELLTLRPAFDADNRQELMTQILNETPPRPRQFNPQIPRDLETIVLKAIAREPQRRYQTAGDLAEDLTSFLNREPIKARPISAPTRLFRWSCRHPAQAALIAIVLLVAFVGAPILAALWRQAETARAASNAATAQAVTSQAIAETARNDAHKAQAEAEAARDIASASQQTAELQRRTAQLASLETLDLVSREHVNRPFSPQALHATTQAIELVEQIQETWADSDPPTATALEHFNRQLRRRRAALVGRMPEPVAEVSFSTSKRGLSPGRQPSFSLAFSDDGTIIRAVAPDYHRLIKWPLSSSDVAFAATRLPAAAQVPANQVQHVRRLSPDGCWCLVNRPPAPMLLCDTDGEKAVELAPPPVLIENRLGVCGFWRFGPAATALFSNGMFVSWDADSGRLLGHFESGVPVSLRPLVVTSSNGRWLAARLGDRTIVLTNPDLKVRDVINKPFDRIAISESGRYLLATMGREVFRYELTDTSTARLTGLEESETEGVSLGELSRDEPADCTRVTDDGLCLVRARDGLRVYEVTEKGIQHEVLRDDSCRYFSAHPAPHSPLVLVTGDQGEIRCWNVQTRRPACRGIQCNGWPLGVGWSHNGREFAVLDSSGRIQVRRIPVGTSDFLLGTGKSQTSGKIVFSPSGDRLVITTDDAVECLAIPAEFPREPPRKLWRKVLRSVNQIAWSHDGRTVLASCSARNKSEPTAAPTWMVDADNGKIRAQLAVEQSGESRGFHFIAGLNNDGSLGFLVQWNQVHVVTGSGERVWSERFDEDAVSAAAIVGDELVLVKRRVFPRTSRIDVVRYEVATGKERTALSLDGDYVGSYLRDAISRDGKLVAIVTNDSIRVLDQTGTISPVRFRRTGSDHPEETARDLRALTFSRDGSTLLAWTPRGTCYAWTTGEWSAARNSFEVPSQIASGELSPDGTLATVLDRSGTVRFYDTHRGHETLPMLRVDNGAHRRSLAVHERAVAVLTAADNHGGQLIIRSIPRETTRSAAELRKETERLVGTHQAR